MQSPRVECLRRACDIYVYSFYKQFHATDLASEFDDETETFTPFNIPYTRTVYNALQEIKYLDYSTEEMEGLQVLPDSFKQEVNEVAQANRFFHWCVEFPEVFADGGGFDVMCGNPPWDKLKWKMKRFVTKDDPLSTLQTKLLEIKKLLNLKKIIQPYIMNIRLLVRLYRVNLIM